MTAQKAREIAANLGRANDAINAAKSLLQNGYYDFAASRAYYAAFYAATALLVEESMNFKRHSGVITAIHQYFVKTGRIDVRLGKNLNWLFELRNIGDYGVIIHIPKEEAEKAIEAAEEFVGIVKMLMQG